MLLARGLVRPRNVCLSGLEMQVQEEEEGGGGGGEEEQKNRDYSLGVYSDSEKRN